MGLVYQLPRAQQSAVLDRAPEVLLAFADSTHDVIAFNRTYAQIAGGDVNAGLLLSQIFFKFKPFLQGLASSWLVEYHGRLWFPRCREDWQGECALSPKKFDRASNVLATRGLIAKRRFRYRGSPTVHVSLNVEALADQVEALGLPSKENGISPKRKMEFPQRGKSLRKISLKIQNPEISSPTPSLSQIVATAPTENSGALRTKDEKTETPNPPSPRTEDPFEALYVALPDDRKVILEEEKRTELIAQGFSRHFLTVAFIRGALGRDLATQGGGAVPVAPDPSAGGVALSPTRPSCSRTTPEIPSPPLSQPKLSTKVLPASLATPPDVVTATTSPMTEAEYAALPEDLRTRMEEQTRTQLGQEGQTRHVLPAVYIREETRRRLTTPADSPLPVAADPSGNDAPLSSPLPACKPPTPLTDSLPICAGEGENGRSGDVQAKAEPPPPTWSNILLVDLQDTGRLLTLYHQCVRLGWIGASPHDRHTFAALAEHVLERVRLGDCDNPGGLYRSLLRKPAAARDRFISDCDEDAASRRLKVYDYGSPPPPPVAKRQPPLSKDAWIVHEVQRTAARHGIHGDIFAQLRLEDPVWWTREHCETVAIELAAYAQTCQQGAALSHLGEVDTGGARPGEVCAECGEDHQTCACQGEMGRT